MSRVTLALVLALVGCKDRKPEAPPAPPQPTKPAPDATPAPPRLRLESFDLELAAPEGARLDGHTLVDGPCRVSFDADAPILSLDDAIAQVQRSNEYETFKAVTRKEATADGFVLAYTVHTSFGDADSNRVWVRRKVAAMRVDCRADDADTACVASTCAALTAVPGGVAEQPFDVTGEPVAETWMGGGFTGGTRALVRVWRDGTVQLAGWGCPKARGTVKTIEPARVDAMLAKIDAVGFRKLGRLAMECCDCVGVGLTVNSDGKPFSRDETVCNGSGDPVLADAIAAVREATGDNPCD